MIKHHEKFLMPDENKLKSFFIEVNWMSKDPKTNECKVLKVTFPNGDEVMLRKEYLAAVLFAIGTEEEQRNLIPQEITHNRWYETTVSVKAKKDIHKGEEITFPIKLSLPALKEEKVGSLHR